MRAISSLTDKAPSAADLRSICVWEAQKREDAVVCIFPGYLFGSAGRIRTCDLKVMSLASYLTAPPRATDYSLPHFRAFVKPNAKTVGDGAAGRLSLALRSYGFLHPARVSIRSDSWQHCFPNVHHLSWQPLPATPLLRSIHLPQPWCPQAARMSHRQ